MSSALFIEACVARREISPLITSAVMKAVYRF
jgi:hypothetical protein